MKGKRRHDPNSLIVLVSVFIAILVAHSIAVLLTGNLLLFYVFAGVAVAMCLWAYLLSRKTGKVITAFYRGMIRKLTLPNSDLYNHFDLPVLVLCGEQVVWYNNRFRSNVLKGDDVVGPLPEEFLSQAARSALRVSARADVEIAQRAYNVYASFYDDQGTQYTVLYYVDLTDLKRIAFEFEQTRPVVAVFSVDSFDEITGDMPESVQAKFKGAIDQEIEAFTSGISGITKKLKNNRYISVFDERSLANLKSDGFSILDKVRGLAFDGQARATLSIGVGHGAPTVKECEVLALQAMEMCQGRGGDQAAIKTGDTYDFFGGVSSSGVEKRTKVKTRVVAAALKELIRGSDRVYIMGHKFGDIDSLGASYALWRCAAAMEKESYIVLDESAHLAASLIRKIKSEAGDGVIITGEKALELITRKSLLIVCDTHRRDFVESAEVYDAVRTTVVIDHHRKSIDFIDNSVIFYHEPHASSACEMVAELIQYIDDELLGPSEADALLAGIMLDTRNFVLRTGVRTFEASAFLRGRGADPVKVKKLFSDSIDVYRARAMLVSNAAFYENCAIAAAEDGASISRVAASQAADELLNIENVDASFVLFAVNGGVNISARSLGKVNVQVIMEALGGGGHHTMAATQIPSCTLDEAKARLIGILQQSTRKDDKT